MTTDRETTQSSNPRDAAIAALCDDIDEALTARDFDYIRRNADAKSWENEVGALIGRARRAALSTATPEPPAAGSGGVVPTFRGSTNVCDHCGWGMFAHNCPGFVP